MTNKWDTHEEDKTIIALDEELKENRLKQFKVSTLLKENKKKVEERVKGMEDLIEMATGKETVGTQRAKMGRLARLSPSAPTLQSSCVDEETLVV